MARETPFSRMEILYGTEAMRSLAAARVAVLGLGGVGGHCAEALARCGIGHFVLMDRDIVSLTNINRQIVALHSTLGAKKTDVMRARILDINPGAQVKTIHAFYLPEDAHGLWAHPLDLIVDAIDTVSAKVDIAAQAQTRGIALVSAMGAGNKTDPTLFEAADLFDTAMCPLCRATRRLARQRDIHTWRVVYSKEEPVPVPQQNPVLSSETGRPLPGSVAFVTAAAGQVLASEAVRLLLER